MPRQASTLLNGATLATRNKYREKHRENRFNLGIQGIERWIAKTARRNRVSRTCVKYWVAKIRHKQHLKPHGGARNFKFLVEVEERVKQRVWKIVKRNPTYTTRHICRLVWVMEHVEISPRWLRHLLQQW